MLCSLAAVLLVQCSKADLSVSMADVETRPWTKSVTVARINEDTTSRYDLNIVLHVNSRYKAEEIALEIAMFSPDSLCYTERVAIDVISSREGITSQSTDITLPYRRDVRLPAMGNYLFTIQPLQPLVGVEAAGINFQLQ